MLKKLSGLNLTSSDCFTTVFLLPSRPRGCPCVLNRRRDFSKTHYDVLGIQKDSSQQEIKDAFLRLSKEFHPDRDLGDPTLHSRFVKLNEAYAVLNRPLSRRQYDLSLLHHHHPDNVGGSAVDPRGSSATEQRRRTFYEQTGFWDPNNEPNTASKPYYGIKGLRRVPNWWIVMGCCILLIVGTAGHFVAINVGNRVSRKVMDEKDRKYAAEYRAVRDRARNYGEKLVQVEMLKMRMATERRYPGPVAARAADEPRPTDP